MKRLQDLRIRDTIRDTCRQCDLRVESSFCQLPAADLRLFESIKVTKIYTKGSTLFVEGQPSAGVYVLCQGQVKLSTCSSDGKVITLGIAEAGEVLGLSAVLSRTEYETTANALETCQVNFGPRDAFLKYLRENPEAALSAAKQLSRNYLTAHKMICSLGHSDPVVIKLARLLLSWAPDANGNNGSLQLRNTFTHQQISEMLGTSRETVTRALRELRLRELATLKGSDLVIHNPDRLRMLSGGRTKLGNGVCDNAHRPNGS